MAEYIANERTQVSGLSHDSMPRGSSSTEVHALTVLRIPQLFEREGDSSC